MSVVGPDDDAVLARVLDDIRQIVRGLAGHVDAVVAEQVLVRQLPGRAAHAREMAVGVFLAKGHLGPGADEEIVHRVRHPLGGGLHEAPAKVRELVRDAFVDEVVERAHGRELEPREHVLGEQVVVTQVAAAGVDADGHVEIAGLPIDGEERVVREQPLPFEAVHEDPAGAVVLAEADLLDGPVRGPRRRQHHPPDTAASLLPDLREPAVVTPAERPLHIGAGGQRTQKQRRIDDLDVHGQLVHVRNARRHVGQLARLRRGVEAEVGVGHDSLVDAPVAQAVMLRDEEVRRKAFVLFLHELPGLFRLDHVGVCIDEHRHILLPCAPCGSPGALPITT